MKTSWTRSDRPFELVGQMLFTIFNLLAIYWRHELRPLSVQAGSYVLESWNVNNLLLRNPVLNVSHNSFAYCFDSFAAFVLGFVVVVYWTDSRELSERKPNELFLQDLQSEMDSQQMVLNSLNHTAQQMTGDVDHASNVKSQLDDMNRRLSRQSTRATEIRYIRVIVSLFFFARLKSMTTVFNFT